MKPSPKFEVRPTSITGQSLLVLPDPEYHTPQLSLQMRTDLANRLAHAANVLPSVVVALRHVIKCHDDYPADGPQGNCSCGTCKVLKAALAAAEKL